MEALASGLLCVASEIRGNVDLIENGLTGYLCDPFEVDDVASAMKTAMESQSKLIHENKKLMADNYSKQTINGIMKDLYKRYI